MIILAGKGVSRGIGIGKLFCLEKKVCLKMANRLTEDPRIELERFEAAKSKASEELAELYQKGRTVFGEQEAKVFQAHRILLEDPEYSDAVVCRIQNSGFSAERAVFAAAEELAELLSSLEDPYMKERAADLRDVSERLQLILNGQTRELSLPEEPVILAAEDLAPSETVSLDRSRVLGFVTGRGAVNSHTAILARSLGLPAVAGVGRISFEEYNGTVCAIDGDTGKVYLDPEEEVLAELCRRQNQKVEEKRVLEEVRGQESITLDGRKIVVAANIGGTEDLKSALENDADGIGLFRSEFLYLGRSSCPGEEVQLEVYRKAVEAMNGKEVIIRTLDLGADKQAACLEMEPEENPALGLRGVRYCLMHRELFKTQLRALLRVGVYGNLAVMFPMIISVREVQECKRCLEEAKAELKKQGIAYQDKLRIGIMIETPAAVWLSAELAKEADFFSVGTNDLIQYTLALDRSNPKLEPFFDPHHPAVLQMLQLVAKNAHTAGIRVGICGELGADLTLTEELLSMGYEEFSVVPGMVLALRKKIRESRIGNEERNKGKQNRERGKK